MTPLIIVVLLGFAGLVCLVIHYRAVANARKAEAVYQRRLTEISEADVKQRHRLDRALNTLHETHREETIHDNAPENRALRADFDNNWANDPRLHSAGTGSNHAASSTAADSTGATSHYVSRTDLSE